MSANDSNIKNWSTTPASNNSNPPQGWPEGMKPSEVNDTARQQMSDHRYQWQDAEWFVWGDTLSKASATSFKVNAADATSRYLTDRRIKIFSTSTLYATVKSSSYSAPDTTVTLEFDDSENTLGASLTSAALSILSPTNTSIPKNLIGGGASGAGSNVVIGGNFDTNPWQRGTTFTSPTTGTFTADRFSWKFVGAGAVTVQKTANAPTVSDAGWQITNCLDVDVTTADASIAATDFYALRYCIEGYDFAQIAQRSFTVSFWVRSTVTGIHCVTFSNSGQDRAWVEEYTINTTNTWEFKSFTITASPSAGTWDYTNGIGLDVFFCLAAGSNFQATAGSWQTTSGYVYGSSNQVNAMSDATNFFRIAAFKIEPGSQVTDYPFEEYEDVRQRCLRYYQKTFSVGVAPAQATADYTGALFQMSIVAAATNHWTMWALPVALRSHSAASVTYYSPVNSSTAWYNVRLAGDAGASATTYLGSKMILVQNGQNASTVAGDSNYLHAAVSNEL